MAGSKQTKGTVSRSHQITDEEMEKMMSDIFEKGMLPKDAMGLTDEMLEGIYGHSYRLYCAGRFRESLQLFRLLIMLNAMEPKYVLGLAANYHMLGQYDNALMAYAVVQALNPKDPMPNYHASDCYMKLGLPDQAITELRKALEICGNHKEQEALRERILMTIANLEKEHAAAQKESKVVPLKQGKEK